MSLFPAPSKRVRLDANHCERSVHDARERHWRNASQPTGNQPKKQANLSYNSVEILIIGKYFNIIIIHKKSNYQLFIIKTYAYKKGSLAHILK